MNWEIAYTNDPNYVRDYSTPEEIRAAGLSVIKGQRMSVRVKRT